MKKYWVSGNYVEFQMTLAQMEAVGHSGDCEVDARQVVEEIRSQLEALNPEGIKKELKEYGAWDPKELADKEMNFVRLVWTLGGSTLDQLITEGKV